MIDVVVLTSDARATVLRCLEHLTETRIASIVVVDNASRDGTAEAVQSARPDVRVIRLDEHRGLSYAFNRGAREGAADSILFLNDDVFARPGAIAALAGALEERPDAVSAGGRLTDEDGTTQDRYRPRPFPTAGALALRLSSLDFLWPDNPWTGSHLRRRLDDTTTVEVDQPAGACLLVRRNAFEEVGGWDERFWFWYEDVDISYRLRDLGVALYVPSAAFHHLGGATVGRWDRPEMHRRTYYGVAHYAELHLSRGGRLLVALALAAVSVPRLGYYAARRHPGADVYRRALGSATALALARPVPQLT